MGEPAPDASPGCDTPALATAAQSGDRRAFEALVLLYRDALYRFIRRYVGDADDAYDLVQDSFISAWLAMSRFDARQSFGGWLRRIALNKCRDHGRRRTARRRLLSLFAVEPIFARSVPAEADGAPGNPESSRLQRLDRAIAELPAFYKEPLLLTSLGDMTQLQVAQLLRTTPKAIEMRIRRARRRLGEALDDAQPQDDIAVPTPAQG